MDYAGYSAHPVGSEQIDSDTLMAVDLYSCVLEFIVYIDWTGSHSRRMKSLTPTVYVSHDGVRSLKVPVRFRRPNQYYRENYNATLTKLKCDPCDPTPLNAIYFLFILGNNSTDLGPSHFTVPHALHDASQHPASLQLRLSTPFPFHHREPGDPQKPLQPPRAFCTGSLRS